MNIVNFFEKLGKKKLNFIKFWKEIKQRSNVVNQDYYNEKILYLERENKDLREEKEVNKKYLFFLKKFIE